MLSPEPPTPERLAQIHAAAFTNERSWSAAEFADLLSNSRCFLLGDSRSFLLAREIAGEVEILTLATDPAHQRCGLAKETLRQLVECCNLREVSEIFLEVSAQNAAAQSLYTQFGFEKIGIRRGYYHHLDHTQADAIVMKIILQPEA